MFVLAEEWYIRCFEEARVKNLDDLVTELTREVTGRSDPAYPELETALRTLICRIRGLDCAEPDFDWAGIIAEATTLRPQPGFSG